MENNNNLEFKHKVIGFVVTIGILIVLYICLFTGKDEKGNKKPDEIELMSYTQTILDDNLNNPKYSSSKEDYNFINTGLRYKIEGKVNEENFWIIIEFTDDTYKEYDLISLQVGNEKIY